MSAEPAKEEEKKTPAGMPWKDMPIPGPLEDEYEEFAWAKPDPTSDFKPIKIARPKVITNYVRFELKYCGVCHSDVHMGNGDLPNVMYPIVPGHELAGVVTEVGPNVTRVKVGDKVGVGCIVDACLTCATCLEGHEMMCESGGSTHTYNTMKCKYEDFGKESHQIGNKAVQNFGGYSGSNVVHEHFLIKIPEAVPLEKAGPIMCAGITMYEPLCHYGLDEFGKKGVKKNVGIIGLGGLGTMGVKLARAMGHDVTVISTSTSKEAVAKEKGATLFVVSTDEASMKTGANKCDLILNTISANHELSSYIPLLRPGGTLVQLGLVTKPHTVSQLPLMFAKKSIAGSLIGGIKRTQELLEFCAEKNVMPDIELIEAKDIDSSWKKLLDNTAGGTRFVIDMEASKKNADFMPK